MGTLLKVVFIVFTASVAFAVRAYYSAYKPGFKQAEPRVNGSSLTAEEFARLRMKASSIKKYCKANHYASNLCFLADMKMASGRKRFFVYDLHHDSILLSGLVAHGSCDNGFQINATFSNSVNSGCSCMGKFRIGKNSYNGNFGTAYKLYGLDSTNGKAYERGIVLHAYECVPDQEIYPSALCNSRGCPMVSFGFLQKLRPYIKNCTGPLLISIFN